MGKLYDPLNLLFNIKTAKHALSREAALAQKAACDDYRQKATGAVRRYRSTVKALKAERDSEKARIATDTRKGLSQLEQMENEKEMEVVNLYTKNPLDYFRLYDLAVGIAYNGWFAARGTGNLGDELKFAKKLVDIYRAADETEPALRFLQERIDDAMQNERSAERKLKRAKGRKEKQKLRKELKAYETMEQAFIELAEDIENDKTRSAESGLVKKATE